MSVCLHVCDEHEMLILLLLFFLNLIALLFSGSMLSSRHNDAVYVDMLYIVFHLQKGRFFLSILTSDICLYLLTNMGMSDEYWIPELKIIALLLIYQLYVYCYITVK